MGVFAVATAGLAFVLGWLVARRHRWLALLVTVVGGLAVLEGVTILSATLVDRWFGYGYAFGQPLLWYWMSVLPYGPWENDDLTSPIGELSDHLLHFPGA